MKVDEIRSFDDLKERVFKCTNRILYHYTSYESLLMILKNKSLRLTRYDLMNDIAEKKLSKCNDGDCRYIISFTRATGESVAMWALYGKGSSIKVRLGFPRKALIKEVDRMGFFFDAEKKQQISFEEADSVRGDDLKRHHFLSDVVYCNHKKDKLKLLGKTLTLDSAVNDNMISQLAGTIKYDAWEYEKETRLSVILQSKQVENTPNIYAGLSEDFLREITITYSPWITNETQCALNAGINAVKGFSLLSGKGSELLGDIARI